MKCSFIYLYLRLEVQGEHTHIQLHRFQQQNVSNLDLDEHLD